MTTPSPLTTPLWLRVARFPLVRLVILGPVLFVMMGVSNGLWSTQIDRPLLGLGLAAGMAVAALTVYVLYARFIERRPVSELSVSALPRDLAYGLLLGFGLYTASVLVLMGLGVYRIEGINPWVALLPALPMAVSSSVFEELIHRGVVFRSLEETVGSWIALAGSALLFGLIHLQNPQATLAGAFAISVEAGLLLAAAYMLTRRLWLSIGLHMAWNYTQSAIFSGVVSGSFAQSGLLRSVTQGPDLLTGGAFGLEASVVPLILCTACGVAILISAVRRGHVVAPFWARASS